MTQYSVAIIGLGRVGHLYDLEQPDVQTTLTHSKSFGQNSSFKIVGGVDPIWERRQLFEKTANCQSFANLESLFNSVQPDVIVVATPGPSHIDVITETALACSPKLILCEKPLGVDPAGFERLEDLGSKIPPILVNFPRRADPAIKKTKTLLREYLQATPLDCVIRYSKGLIEGASHFIDLLSFLIDGEQTGRKSGASRLSELDLTVSGTWYALCEGKGLRIALLENQHGHVPLYSLELMTPHGRLHFWHDGRIDWDTADAKSLFPLSGPVERWRGLPAHSQLFVVNEVLSYLENGSTSLCTLSEARMLHDFLQKIRQQTG